MAEAAADTQAQPSTPEEEWNKKEEAYQAQIANLRKLNEKLLNYSEEKQKTYEHNVQKLQNERDIIQKRLEKMELDELREAASGSSKNIEAFKEKYDKVLKQAQDLLFERQKTIKSLELKIEAQHIQIESLKDVVSLTKDMLGIRESEVRDLTERMDAMAVKFKAERDCKALMQRKMDLSDKLNVDLKSEYKAQKEIFDILKGQYKSKVELLEAKLKLNSANESTASTSTTTNGHSEPSNA